MAKGKYGNCYHASEALYHLMGGKRAGWKAMFVRVDGGPHWYLQHKDGMVLDITRRQFWGRVKPNYHKGRGTGFLTKHPARRTLELMDKIVWQEIDNGKTR